ncbi:MAG: hypothetical protein JWN95_1521 [Frankiales bacterium]|nr:hypothetical protein [Frankiales bacterium]
MKRPNRLVTAALAAAVLGAAGCQSATGPGGHPGTPATTTTTSGAERDGVATGSPGGSSSPGPKSAPSASKAPAAQAGFSLLIQTRRGDIAVPVAPFTATVHPDGSADPIDPPHSNPRGWATAAWIAQSAYPSAPPSGTSYIYGHACHYHACSFTRLHDATPADNVVVRTSSSQLTYQICATGLSPKSGNLVVPACKNHAHVDLVLVTCQFEQGDTSTNNLVLAATLLEPTPAHS